MWRLTDRIVRSGFVIGLALGDLAHQDLAVLREADHRGVVREPSAFGITTGSPASSTDTTEFVVPRSIPTARAICVSSFFRRPIAA